MNKLRLIVREGFRRGALALEMTVIAPLFIVVAFGIIEIGRGVMVNKIVENAAHEGARTAALNGSTNVDVVRAVQAFMSSALGLSASDVVVEITTVPNEGRPDQPCNIADCQSGELINVQVQVPLSRVALVCGDYFAGTMLIGNSAMRRE